jgi:hypothetical protein
LRKKQERERETERENISQIYRGRKGEREREKRIME